MRIGRMWKLGAMRLNSTDCEHQWLSVDLGGQFPDLDGDIQAILSIGRQRLSLVSNGIRSFLFSQEKWTHDQQTASINWLVQHHLQSTSFSSVVFIGRLQRASVKDFLALIHRLLTLVDVSSEVTNRISIKQRFLLLLAPLIEDSPSLYTWETRCSFFLIDLARWMDWLIIISVDTTGTTSLIEWKEEIENRNERISSPCWTMCLSLRSTKGNTLPDDFSIAVVVLQSFESRLDWLSWKPMRLIHLIEPSPSREHSIVVLSLSLDCLWSCRSLSKNPTDLKSRTTRSCGESANRDRSRERPGVFFEDLRADLFEICDIDHSSLKSSGKEGHSIHVVDSADEEQSDWTSSSTHSHSNHREICSRDLVEHHVELANVDRQSDRRVTAKPRYRLSSPWPNKSANGRFQFHVQLNIDRQVNQSIEWRLRRKRNDRVVFRFVSERINVRLRPENSVGRRYD